MQFIKKIAAIATLALFGILALVTLVVVGAHAPERIFTKEFLSALLEGLGFFSVPLFIVSGLVVAFVRKPVIRIIAAQWLALAGLGFGRELMTYYVYQGLSIDERSVIASMSISPLLALPLNMLVAWGVLVLVTYGFSRHAPPQERLGRSGLVASLVLMPLGALALIFA